jgi:hypothetical protein
MYLFYLITRIIDFEAGIKLLPELQQRVGYWDDSHENFKGFNLTMPLQTKKVEQMLSLL